MFKARSEPNGNESMTMKLKHLSDVLAYGQKSSSKLFYLMEVLIDPRINSNGKGGM